MNILAQLFKTFVVSGVVWTFNFLRRHPWWTLGGIVFFLVLPFLIETMAIASVIYFKLLAVVDFFAGKDENGDDVGFAQKWLRKALLVAIWFIVPGSSLLFAGAVLSANVGRARVASSNMSASH